MFQRLAGKYVAQGVEQYLQPGETVASRKTGEAKGKWTVVVVTNRAIYVYPDKAPQLARRYPYQAIDAIMLEAWVLGIMVDGSCTDLVTFPNGIGMAGDDILQAMSEYNIERIPPPPRSG